MSRFGEWRGRTRSVHYWEAVFAAGTMKNKARQEWRDATAREAYRQSYNEFAKLLGLEPLP